MQRALNMIYGIYFDTTLPGKIQSYSQLTRIIKINYINRIIKYIRQELSDYFEFLFHKITTKIRLIFSPILCIIRSKMVHFRFDACNFIPLNWFLIFHRSQSSSKQFCKNKNMMNVFRDKYGFSVYVLSNLIEP